MNDAQTWTLIGGFIAVVGIMLTMLLRTVDAKIDGIAGRIDSRFETVDVRFAALEEKMNTRFDAVDRRLEHLDGDVQALTQRVFGRENG